MKNKIDIKKILLVVIPTLAVAIAIGVAIAYGFILRSEVRNEVMLNLSDVTEQNSYSVEHKINDSYDMLRGLENELRKMPGDMRDNITELRPFAEAYGLLRIAFCDENGLSYGTGEHDTTQDLTHRQFFVRGMQGKRTVTEILYDAMTEAHDPLNIISAPMYDGDRIIGVIGMTYYSQSFNKSLQVPSFDGMGYSCVINGDGQVLVSINETGSELTKNLFTDVLSDESGNADDISYIKHLIETKGEGNGVFDIYGVTSYYCFKPLIMLDGDVEWYILTVVPESYLDGRIERIDRSIVIIFVLFFSLVGLSVGAIFLLTRRQRKEVYRLAYIDSVTGGKNFARFERDLAEMRPHLGAFVAMDIAAFSTVNVALGVEKGDRVLCDVYKTLERGLKQDETLARLSKDNFVLFMQGGDTELVTRIEAFAVQISSLAEKFQSPAIRARFGIFRSHSACNADEGYNCARQAKEVVRNSSDLVYSFYRGEDNQRLMRERALIDSFDAAIDNEEFEVWLQPKYSVETKKIVGAEALVRWMHDGERISPGVFIPLAEKSGHIARIDEYMFRRICTLQKSRMDEGKSLCPVSVNLSRASLCYDNVVEKYLDMIRSVGIEPKHIQLEVTEGTVDGKDEAVSLIDGFRDAGIKILMDDFGTGYSSLSLLGSGRFDTIKLDKSLTDNIGDPGGENLLGHIITMAKDLGMAVTVEGVETEEQFLWLKVRKCDDIQGYYFSRPLPIPDFLKLLDSESSQN